MLEIIQRRATKLIPGPRYLRYEGLARGMWTDNTRSACKLALPNHYYLVGGWATVERTPPHVVVECWIDD